MGKDNTLEAIWKRDKDDGLESTVTRLNATRKPQAVSNGEVQAVTTNNQTPNPEDATLATGNTQAQTEPTSPAPELDSAGSSHQEATIVSQEEREYSDARAIFIRALQTALHNIYTDLRKKEENKAAEKFKKQIGKSTWTSIDKMLRGQRSILTWLQKHNKAFWGKESNWYYKFDKSVKKALNTFTKKRHAFANAQYKKGNKVEDLQSRDRELIVRSVRTTFDDTPQVFEAPVKEIAHQVKATPVAKSETSSGADSETQPSVPHREPNPEQKKEAGRSAEGAQTNFERKRNALLQVLSAGIQTVYEFRLREKGVAAANEFRYIIRRGDLNHVNIFSLYPKSFNQAEQLRANEEYKTARLEFLESIQGPRAGWTKDVIKNISDFLRSEIKQSAAFFKTSLDEYTYENHRAWLPFSKPYYLARENWTKGKVSFASWWIKRNRFTQLVLSSIPTTVVALITGGGSIPVAAAALLLNACLNHGVLEPLGLPGLGKIIRQNAKRRAKKERKKAGLEGSTSLDALEESVLINMRYEKSGARRSFWASLGMSLGIGWGTGTALHGAHVDVTHPSTHPSPEVTIAPPEINNSALTGTFLEGAPKEILTAAIHDGKIGVFAFGAYHTYEISGDVAHPHITHVSTVPEALAPKNLPDIIARGGDSMDAKTWSWTDATPETSSVTGTPDVKGPDDTNPALNGEKSGVHTDTSSIETQTEKTFIPFDSPPAEAGDGLTDLVKKLHDAMHEHPDLYGVNNLDHHSILGRIYDASGGGDYARIAHDLGGLDFNGVDVGGIHNPTSDSMPIFEKDVLRINSDQSVDLIRGTQGSHMPMTGAHGATTATTGYKGELVDTYTKRR